MASQEKEKGGLNVLTRTTQRHPAMSRERLGLRGGHGLLAPPADGTTGAHRLRCLDGCNAAGGRQTGGHSSPAASR